MPSVTRYDTLTSSPVERQIPMLDTPSQDNIFGRQDEILGKGLQSAGEGLGAVAGDMFQKTNQLRVDEALNQVKDKSLSLAYSREMDPDNGLVGFSTLKGSEALNRPGGKPLAEEYGEALKKHIADIAGTLTNEDQKRNFAIRANDLLETFRGEAMKHEYGEYTTYGLSVADGIQKTSINSIGLNPADLGSIQSNVENIKKQTYVQAGFLGRSKEWADAQAQADAGKGYKTAALSLIEKGNPGKAKAIVDTFGRQMQADDLLEVNTHLDNEMNIATAAKVSRDHIATMAPMGSFQALSYAVETQESGHHQRDRNGNPLTSSANAVGVMQVTKAAGIDAAKRMGEPFDEKRWKEDEKYNRMLGQNELEYDISNNGGDIARALAAYNAGQGRLNGALRKAQETGRRWLEFMPAETRAYVPNVLAMYRKNMAAHGQLPTFDAISQGIMNDKRLRNNPKAQKLALEMGRKSYDDQLKDIKTLKENAMTDFKQSAIDNHGDISKIPPATRMNVPPERYNEVIDFAARIAKGVNVTDPVTYMDLISHPDKLASLSDEEMTDLRLRLAEDDWKMFANKKAEIQGLAKPCQGPSSVDHEAFNRVVNSRFVEPYVYDNGKEDMVKDNKNKAEFNSIPAKFFIDRALRNAQAQAGRKFTEGDIQKFVDALLLQTGETGAALGWFSRGNVKKPLLLFSPDVIPYEENKKIEKNMKDRDEDPTDNYQKLLHFWSGRLGVPLYGGKSGAGRGAR